MSEAHQAVFALFHTFHVFGNIRNIGQHFQEQGVGNAAVYDMRGFNAAFGGFDGRERPSASVRQFMELAVNMPEQEPGLAVVML